ncbi:MAG: 16S rRNA (cytosine(967)-C(5))-methyltransferase RsmB [Eubacterium sp.]|nr:16S rRNA (cytosine(967)-C(5))-methyltransferase RsmB [Eubacterium sp.]
MKPARLSAFELIYGVFNEGAYSNLSLDSALSEVKAEDRAFLSALTLGVIERKITLEYIIAPHLKSKPKPKVMLLIMLGAYQLYFMDKVPSSAAINETVELSKKVGCAYYSGLINAVLHSIDRERTDIGAVADLSVKYSCPDGLINMWKKHYGEEAALQILESINEAPPVFAVPNPLYVDADELAYELMCDGVECEADDGLVIIYSSINLSKCRAFKNGLFHIEDKSSYLCALALEAEEGDTVIDLCSAPGGKAFTVAERMNNTGRVYACDIHSHRVELIKNGAKRLGLENIITEVNDASIYNSELPKADRVLCDVPCSGFGIIRRKPEIRYKELDSVKELSELQYAILKTGSQYLKKGGRIVYSTCTLNNKENEKVTERLLNENPDFRLVSQTTVLPDKNGGDGFYFAVMEN